MGSGLGTCTAFASCCLWVSEGAWFWFCPHGKPLESWQLGRVGFYHLQKDEVRLRGMHVCVFASGFQMWAVFIVNFGESCGFIWLSFKCWVSLLSKKYIYRLWNADTVMIRSWNPGAVTISIVSPAGAGKVLHACLGGRKYGHSYLGSAAFLYLLLACFMELLFKGLCNLQGSPWHVIILLFILGSWSGTFLKNTFVVSSQNVSAF